MTIKRAGISAVLLLLILLAGCTGSESPPSPKATEASLETVAGTDEPVPAESFDYLLEHYDTFTIDGSTSMIPLHKALNSRFSSTYDVWHSRTVDAFEKFIAGENDILLGVDYSDELLEKAKNSGIELVQKEITREAFVFLIHASNPVQSLTAGQIKDIYSGKITNWAEVGGDDAPIKAFQRNSDSGSQIRMVKFMDGVPLMEKDVEYISNMGDVVEKVSDYDQGEYSIAYNMYTFTERQYMNEDVALLSVDGVPPDDGTIFDGTYPIVIYNYLYYDGNNARAVTFANHLYAYLMSADGRRMIGNSGYVNLTEWHDVNKYTNGSGDFNNWATHLGFYNEEKGEFYDVAYDEEEKGTLLVFANYPDYVLRDSPYAGHEKAREFLTLVFDSGLIQGRAYILDDKGEISINPWWDASLDPEDFFNFKYEDKYYYNFTYNFLEDQYTLEAIAQDTIDNYTEWLDDFSGYVEGVAPGSVAVLTREDLSELYLRTLDNLVQPGDIRYFQPFQP